MQIFIDDRSGVSMFQSAPDREAGRCSASIETMQAAPRFNPRPTVRPGDASV